MLVYRIVRAPERRVFYIDVGNVPPEEISNYMEQAQTSLKRNRLVDKQTGKMDLRYNPLAVDEDYFIPVRGGETGTKIDSLAGGTNAAAIEDVQYIQKKLFAALKIPKAYLGYDEDIGAKATLAQEDIRFSRTISRIQKVIISELNKIAMIHLYAHGYEGEELLNFSLKLSNPSSIAQQQKLELISTRFDIAGKAPEGLVDRRWIRKNIMGFTDDEIEEIKVGLAKDKVEGDEGGAAAAGGALTAGFEPEGDLVVSGAEPVPILSIEDEELPLRAEEKIKGVFGNKVTRPRDRSTSASRADMPDLGGMVNNKRSQDSMNDPVNSDVLFDTDFAEGRNKNFSLIEKLYGQPSFPKPKMTAEMENSLGNMRNKLGTSSPAVLNEEIVITKEPSGEDE